MSKYLNIRMTPTLFKISNDLATFYGFTSTSQFIRSLILDCWDDHTGADH